jgi:hypothetical protein
VARSKDQDAWITVESYKSKGDKGELNLKIRGKKYGFPMSPKAFEAFKRKVKSSQKGALEMAGKYIRTKPKPPYKGEWQGRMSSYSRKNRLPLLGRAKKWDVSEAKRTYEEK